ncbi:MAG: hypothetical protein AAF385_12485 [Pseudomonadota bacterium]
MIDNASSLSRSVELFGLRRTWQVAREHSPFYRDWLPDLDKDAITIDALRALPVLTKNTLSENYLDIYGDKDLPAGVLFTGGTTGAPQMVPVTSDEIAFRNELAVLDEQDTPHRTLTLVTSGGSQGRLQSISADRDTVCVPLRSKSGYDWAWRMLTRTHKFRNAPARVTRLALPLPAIKKLVNYMAENGFDRSDLALDIALSFSSYVSRGWRARIEQALGAKLVDCYGFTEAPVARALECKDCGHYHMPESVIAEYLAIDSDDPVEAGIARLCVTTLYPNTQGLILFRYDPGDIVKVGPLCPRTKTKGFLPKGRRSQTVSIKKGERSILPIFATDVQEALDIHHWVARSRNLRHGGVTASEDDSWPKWRLSIGDAISTGKVPVILEVELTSGPAFFHDEWKSFHDAVYETVLAENPHLTHLITTQAVDFQIRGLSPGMIAENEIVRC